MNRADNHGVFRVNLDSLAQLSDMLIQRSAVGQMVQAPTLIEEHISRDHNATVFMKKRQDLDIPETQLDRITTASSSQFGRKNIEVAKTKRRG